MKSPTRSKKTAAKPKSRSKSSSRSKRQDAVALLKADHRKVEGLFKKAEKASGSAKEKLVEQVCNELIIHTMLEEEIFYPACRAGDVEEDMMDEAQVEHDGAKVLINDLMKADADSEMYDAKVTVLSEYIKHHVKEEEKPRSGVFAEAKRNGVDLEGIGEQLMVRKQELMGQAESGSLPEPEPKAVGTGAAGAGRKSDRSNGGGLRHMALAARRAVLGE
jgi:hemerythrin superfamily protein